MNGVFTVPVCTLYRLYYSVRGRLFWCEQTLIHGRFFLPCGMESTFPDRTTHSTASDRMFTFLEGRHDFVSLTYTRPFYALMSTSQVDF